MKFSRIVAALVALMLMCCCALAEAPAATPAATAAPDASAAPAPEGEQTEVMYSAALLSSLQIPYESWFEEGMPACLSVALMLDAAFAEAAGITEIMATSASAPEAYVCEYADERGGNIIDVYLFFADMAEDGTSAGGRFVTLSYNAVNCMFIGESGEYTGAPADMIAPITEDGVYAAAHHVPAEVFAATLSYMNAILTGQTTVQ